MRCRQSTAKAIQRSWSSWASTTIASRWEISRIRRRCSPTSTSVISVDTSVAHLAGALGKPVWILLPWMCDYRWLLDRPDSPWYPSARLFRQHAAGDWEQVIESAASSLAMLRV